MQLGQVNRGDHIAAWEVDESIRSIPVSGGLDMLPSAPCVAKDQRLVRDAREIPPRFDQGTQVLHLASAGALHSVDPVSVYVVNASIASIRKAPNRVVSVGDTASTRKYRAVDLFANVEIAEVPSRRVPIRPGIVGMIFVVWFQ